MDEIKKKGGFLRTVIGTLVVGAAGLIAGLLLAPASGKKTREEIKKKAEELLALVTEEAEKKAELVKETGEVARKAYVEVVEEVVSRVQKTAQYTKEQLTELKSILIEKQDEVVSSVKKKKKQ